MKKILAIVIATMLLCGAAFAEDLTGKTQEELIAMIEELQTENAEYREQLGIEEETEEEESAGETAEEAAPAYIDLPKGSRGEEARQLQLRLIELGYLTGSADGIYGNGTAGAVSSFQSQHDLPVTGNADVATQELLFSEEAQQAIVYGSLQYTAVSRDPDQFEGQYVRFSGKVLQVIEYSGYACFRIATRGNYDDVVYVTMPYPEEYSRILEDDRVEVFGQYAGLKSYETVMGSTVTIPEINASIVNLK